MKQCEQCGKPWVEWITSVQPSCDCDAAKAEADDRVRAGHVVAWWRAQDELFGVTQAQSNSDSIFNENVFDAMESDMLRGLAQIKDLADERRAVQLKEMNDLAKQQGWRRIEEVVRTLKGPITLKDDLHPGQELGRIKYGNHLEETEPVLFDADDIAGVLYDLRDELDDFIGEEFTPENKFLMAERVRDYLLNYWIDDESADD